MEELTIADLQQKAEEARRRYRSAAAEPQAATVAEVVRAVVPSRYRIHQPDRPLPPDEIARRRQELARRVPRPEPRLPPPAVPERYRDARWSTWEPKCDAIETARKAVELWVRTVAEGKHVMLALVGPKGTGKSHMLACAAHQLYEEHRIRAGFFEWFLVADQLRDIDTAAKVRERLREARPLILDECRPTSNTDFDAIELAKITMYAYSHMQSVLIATNWASLEELMGEPAADRYTIVPVIGPSAR